MDVIEHTIDQYMQQFGDATDREMHELYQGSYQEVFSQKTNKLEESVGFGGEVALGAVLVFILQAIGSTFLEDCYKLGKDKIAERINRNQLVNLAEKVEIKREVTLEVLDNLIVILQEQRSSLDKEPK